MTASTRATTTRRTGRAIAGLGIAAALVAQGATPAAAGPAPYGTGPATPGSSPPRPFAPALAGTPRTSGTSGAPSASASPGASAKGLTLSLPAPTGRHPIGTVSLHLVDRSRPDSLVPSQPYRELMVSLWYPARRSGKHPLAPQMPPLAAADFDRDTAADLGIKPGEVNWAATRTHARAGAPVDRRAGGLPVVLFSPGYEAPRTLSTVLVEELASRGYLVVTVDHTHQLDQVEFPGGRVERSRLPPVRTEQEQAGLFGVLMPTRVADMRFVLDRLARLDRGQNPDAARVRLPAGLRGAPDLSRVGVFGHSMGGATAARLVHEDRRVDAGANLDGVLLGPVAGSGVSKPFLQVAGETTTRRTEPTWKSFWERSTGWKREIRFAGARHFSFFDLQAMFPQLAGKLKDVPVAETIGTIDPARSVAAQRAHLTAFFDLHLRGRQTRLFDGPSRTYPEVRPIP
ncbi:lipase [Streptosporangium sp. NPDC023615]|uniref:alpha/beta hydrolase family protein n=1 Tax=Streptosporangium sp. NPDC023615 TaxID=3154794 RepID=UPI00343D2BB8